MIAQQLEFDSQDSPLILGDLLSATEAIKSKGLMTSKARSLADIHRRRAEAQGQFFTPRYVAQGIWQVLAETINKATSAGMRISVIDSSVGTGRLLEPAPVDLCEFYGIDPDERCIAALSDSLAESPAIYDFRAGLMQELTAGRFDLAVINPPYGLHLESPNLMPYDCTTYGRFGPCTSALSHEYALHQALDAARVVAAVLPLSMDAMCRREERLAAIYRLPRNAFTAEGANVATAVYIFSKHPCTEVLDVAVRIDEAWELPSKTLGLVAQESWKRPRWHLGSYDESVPTITTPVTGNKRVTLGHHARRIVLKFACGLVEAKVLNGLLVKDVRPRENEVHKLRAPSNIRYTGDGKFYLDAYLLQSDPDRAFQGLLNQISEAGGEPEVSPSLLGYWNKLKKRHAVLSVPFRHQIKSCGTGQVSWRAKRSFLLVPGDLSSPPVRKGTVLVSEPLGGEYRIVVDGFEAVLRRDQLQGLCELVDDSGAGSGEPTWELIHPGVEAKYPELGRNVRAKLAHLGIDKWLWPYQLDSVVELLIRPAGAVMAWEQACGKARGSIALAYYSGKGLVVVESGLLPEMIIEISGLPIPAEDWQVIRSVEDTVTLRRINIVSYETLRSAIGKRMLADKLRRRINTLIADEGSLLRNERSQRSRAVLKVSPRRLIVADGTPIPNYPRDILPLIGHSSGNGVAHQPYGLNNGIYMKPELLHDANCAVRGIDKFRFNHVVLDWAVHEFREDLRTGAKREIPRINNLPAFRDLLSTTVQRRLRAEPGVKEYAGCPDPVYIDHKVQWDKRHLQHYLDVAVNFAHWYKEQRSGLDGKGVNLVQVLARIQAVATAANNPHVVRDSCMSSYGPVTTKQLAVVDRIAWHVQHNRKTLVYCYSPECVDRLNSLLVERHGIESVIYTGKQAIKNRTSVMDAEFRKGSKMVMLSSWVCQRGVNLGVAKAVVLYQRHFAGDVEPQAVARTQRPDQTDSVMVDRFHLQGSIDEYIAQMVEWKVRAADSGLDWGDGATEEDQFIHLDHILEKFCNDVMAMSTRDSLDHLIAA